MLHPNCNIVSQLYIVKEYSTTPKNSSIMNSDCRSLKNMCFLPGIVIHFSFLLQQKYKLCCRLDVFAVERNVTGDWEYSDRFRHCYPCANYTQINSSAMQWVMTTFASLQFCTSPIVQPSPRTSYCLNFVIFRKWDTPGTQFEPRS